MKTFFHYCRMAEVVIRKALIKAALFALAGPALSGCLWQQPHPAANDLMALRDRCIAEDVRSCQDLCQYGDQAACSDYKMVLCEREASCLP